MHQRNRHGVKSVPYCCVQYCTQNTQRCSRLSHTHRRRHWAFRSLLCGMRSSFSFFRSVVRWFLFRAKREEIIIIIIIIDSNKTMCECDKCAVSHSPGQIEVFRCHTECCEITFRYIRIYKTSRSFVVLATRISMMIILCTFSVDGVPFGSNDHLLRLRV